NVAVDHFSVHRIRRLFESGVYESDDLTTELRDKSNHLSARVRLMLPALSVACQYRLNCGERIAFRIKAGVILSTLQERACDTVFWNSRTDRNRHFGRGFVHDRKISQVSLLHLHSRLWRDGLKAISFGPPGGGLRIAHWVRQSAAHIQMPPRTTDATLP